MEAVHHTFTGLRTLIDQVHALFAPWLDPSGDGAVPPVSEEVCYWARQLTHEWVANLVQHASFDGRIPEIVIHLKPQGNRLHGIIDDNSTGFDLATTLRDAPDLPPLPNRGMGLKMMQACAETLTYERLGPAHHRLEFVVSDEHVPWLNLPFSS